MKNKTYSILISLLFFIVSLAIIISIYFIPDFGFKSLVLNLGYSVFGGSLLSIAISTIDYLTSKKATINDFYDECFEFIRLLNNIDFFYIGDKELIIVEYLFSKHLIESDNKAKDEFKTKAVKVFSEQGWECDSDNIILIIENESKPFEEKLTNSMVSYIELSNYLVDRLIRISSDIYFFSPVMRKNHKENIDLCKMAKDIMNMASICSLHFSYYLKRETTNIYAVTKYVQKLNDYIFKIEKRGNSVLAWKEKMNSFSELLSAFFFASRGEKYVKREYPPFFESVLLINNDKK